MVLGVGVLLDFLFIALRSHILNIYIYEFFCNVKFTFVVGHTEQFELCHLNHSTSSHRCEFSIMKKLKFLFLVFIVRNMKL
jgi:hypothetical protein